MRTMRLVLFLSLLATLAAACGPSQPSIVGTWEGTYGEATLTITFGQDGKLTAQGYGTSRQGTYKADLAAKPATLDMQFADEDPVRTIIELVDANTLRIENNYPGDPRPAAFSDFIELKRK